MKNSTTLRVVAPATLPEGYQFDVELDGSNYTVTVPEGGVEKGQEFEIPWAVTSRSSNSNSGSEEGDDDGGHILSGHWRVPLCSCCNVFTQATFWMGFICTPILMAQLLTRLRLNWKGQVDSDEETALAFNKIVLGAIAVLIIGYIPVIGWIVVMIYWWLVVFWIGATVRRRVRERYKIPAKTNLEDAVCMCCCSCCAAIQMARQTHDDTEYPGYCCTTHGLEPDAPALV